MHKFLLITFLYTLSLSSLVNAQSGAESWLKMYPLVNCPSLVLEYIPLKNGEYKVRIPKTKNHSDNKNYFESVIIGDLNDLSEITDYIVNAENDYCPNNDLTLKQNHNSAVCPEYSKKYTEDYVDLIKNITNVVNKDRKLTCDNFLPYIKLQSEVEQLSKEELINFKSTKNIFHKLIKLAVGDKTDEMVDHFNACGGKKGSSKFIKNMVLLEARNACIVPKPEGILSWEDAQKIATKIGNKYSKKSLITLNSKINSITKDTILEFADKITNDMVADIVGPFFDPDLGSTKEQTNSFVNNLQSYKNLKQTKTLDITNYVSHVYGIDAAIEVGANSLPFLIKSNFKDKLPASWSKDQKNKFIEERMIAKAKETYNSCMKDEKEYSKYNLKSKDDPNSNQLLSHRLSLKNKFCTSHPEKCSSARCAGSANILSIDDTATDTQRVQGCVLKSMTLAVKPLLSGTIKDQKKEFIKSFYLSNDMADSFTSKTWNTLISCVNRKIGKKYKADKGDFLNDEKYLQKISTDDFKTHLTNCADIAENKVTKEFVSQMILNQDSLKDAFTSGEVVTDRYGNTHNSEIINITKEITSTSFTPCLEKQYELFQGSSKHGLDKKNTLLCTPLVEMNASLLVVQKKLEDMAKEKNLQSDSEVKLILNEYETCGDNALENALNDIGSTTSETSINNVNDSKEYLERNNSLFNCVEKAISSIAFVIAGTEYEKIANDQKTKVQNPKYLYSLKNNVQNVVKECFSDGLRNLEYYGYIATDKTGNEMYVTVSGEKYELMLNQSVLKMPKLLKKQGKWSAFTSFNEDDGLSVLQKECELKAAQEVIPKLIIKEAKSQLIPLLQTGFLENKTQVNNILNNEAKKLRQKYKLVLPKGIKESQVVDFSFSQSLEIHVKEGGTTDSFIQEVSEGTENLAIIRIHKNLVSTIQKNTKNTESKEKYTRFGNSFKPDCLLKINTLLSKKKKSDTDKPITLGALAEYLKMGLDYSFANSKDKYNQDLKVLKNQCDNMSKFETTKDFNSSKFYELILKGQIYNSFKTQFKEQIDKQIEGIKNEVTPPNLATKNKFIAKLQVDMDKLFKEKLNEIQFEKMMFSDNKLLSFTQRNLDALLLEDTKVKDELTEMLLTNAFADISKGSFASDFTKGQITSAIGLVGIDSSVETANDQATWLKIKKWRFGPNNYAMDSVKEILGSPAKVEKELNWDNISKKQRAIYINSVAHSSVIGTTKNKEFKKNTKESLIFMYSQDYLKINPTPMDTNPDYFNKSANMHARLKYIMNLKNMKDKLANYTALNGWTDFNNKLEEIVSTHVEEMNLSNDTIKKNKFNFGSTQRPNKNEVKNMLIAELRSYITETNVVGGLENYQYAHGKSFSEKIEADITSKTQKKIFGTTEKQKKAREEANKRRLEWKVQNPLWGPKF
jgi:hypothetical protein